MHNLTADEDREATESFAALMAKVDGNSKQPSDVKSDRGYFDGCFDLCHSGHFNAIRQAASTVNTLLIGPNSDEEILRYKGPTIMNG